MENNNSHTHSEQTLHTPNFIELQQLPSGFNYGKNDHQIIKLWDEIGLTELIEQKNKSGEPFLFMDGPPFVSSANLHYGHIHVSCCKSVILNYQNMLGKNVHNKIGYDCHGLPIEMVVNKLLNIDNREDVEKLGINNYIDKCKEVIKEYSGSWQNIFKRIGRLVNFTNEYKTLDFEFMETTWWIFKQLWDKGLVYKGFKVMPYSTGCQTALSNFEASQEYVKKEDPAIFVKFKSVSMENTFFIAWTTTPWTLPSNLALCIHYELSYVKIQDKKSNEYWIVGENNCDKLYQKEKNKDKPYVIIEKIQGEKLIGLGYVPIFEYFAKNREFKIIHGAHVTSDSGTAIVHTAPGHGEEDFQVCIENNIVSVTEIGNYCPINDSGCFTKKIPEYEGIYVLDANESIIQNLKKRGILIKKEMHSHNYPYCWRTHTPLLHRAVSSYFIEVTKIKEAIISNNSKVNWIPNHIGTNRFFQWLDSIRDWGVSRSRFFGTPLPVWISDDEEEIICVESAEELEKLAELDTKLDDLHRDKIDFITIPSKKGKGPLKNCQLVFDCWFESGSVPYGQIHYPFENKNFFENTDYLSQFICEGVDQTRGWFYTLLVLSSALFDKPPYQNVICTGLILAEDGRKFAKKLGNYSSPLEILDKYGADSLRLYLTGSVAAHADSFKFINKDIENILKKLVQFMNGYKFLIEHYTKFIKDDFKFDPTAYSKTTNIMDKWILARVQNLSKKISTCLNKYEVHHATSEFLDMIEDLTNWYIKFNRNRIRRRNCNIDEQTNALSTLWYCYLQLSKIMAPYIPFLSETIYQELKKLSPVSEKSVLLEKYPLVYDFEIDANIEYKMKNLQYVASIIRQLRSSNSIATSIKKPLLRVILSHTNENLLQDMRDLEKYLKEEINVIQIDYVSSSEMEKYTIKPDYKKLGTKYKSNAPKIANILKNLPQSVLKEYYHKMIPSIASLNITIDNSNYNITSDEFLISSEIRMELQTNQSAGTDQGWYVIVDFTQTSEILDIYRMRLLVTSIQQIKKNTCLRPWDKIKMYYETNDDELAQMIQKFNKQITEELIYELQLMEKNNSNDNYLVSETIKIDDKHILIMIMLDQ